MRIDTHGDSAMEQLLGRLLQQGQEQGHLTYDEILSAFPEADESIERLEGIYDALESAGIEVLDVEDLESDGKPAPPAKAEDEDESDLASLDIFTKEAVDHRDALGAYLSQIGKVPLLTQEEEIALAERIERGVEARRQLIEGPASARKLEELERLIQDGLAAREHLILANSRLVISVAKKHSRRGIPFRDLIQEGHIGLMRAVKKYDYRRGYKFSTYATWWIRQAISRYIADQGRTIRVPVHMGDQISKLLRIRHQLTQDLHQTPTIEELARSLNVSIRKVKDTLRYAQRTTSLETPIGDDGDSVLGDLIEDEAAPDPEESVNHILLEERMENSLGTLPARHARVLSLRFGLRDGKVRTLSEVGERMGISRERVRQIEAQALRRLRRLESRSELRGFLGGA